MKTKFFLTALFVALPLSMMAQDDDMYFVPKKKDKTAKQTSTQTTPQYSDGQFDESMVDGDANADYHVGVLRSDDEYNRRGKYSSSRYGEVRVGNDTLYIEDNDNAEDQVPEEDYNYSGRLVRFYGGIHSPYYWDYYYDWAYDPFFYDPFYYGPGYAGWYGGYYGPWYRHGWYGWYDPWYYGGHWGWGGYGHGGYAHHHDYSGTMGSRYGGQRSSIGGISASRGRGNSLASTTRGNRFDYTRGSMSASRSQRFTDNGTRTSSVNRSSRYTDNSRNATTNRSTRVINSNNNISTNRSARTTTTTQTTPRTQTTYTPTPSRSSSSSFSGSSAGRSGGSFGGGGSSSRGGGGGGGRGGR